MPVRPPGTLPPNMMEESAPGSTNNNNNKKQPHTHETNAINDARWETSDDHHRADAGGVRQRTCGGAADERHDSCAAHKTGAGEEGDAKQCKICLGGEEEEAELGRLISPCKCRGTIKYVHVECLNQWRKVPLRHPRCSEQSTSLTSPYPRPARTHNHTTSATTVCATLRPVE